MEKLTIKQKIGATMLAIGMTGIIASASALEVSPLALLYSALPFLLIAAIGVVLANSKTAEAEAPAVNTMKRGDETANS